MRTMRKGMCALALTVGAAAVCACPTVLNVMPTADTMAQGWYTVQAEGIANDSPLGDDATRSLLTEFGACPNVEVGVDLVDMQNESDWTFDAKWRVIQETAERPAVALGLLNINRGRDRGYYATGAKSIGRAGLRLHAGLLHVDDNTSGMVGAEAEILPGTAVIADWITGSDGTLGLGLAQALDARYGVQVFYLDNNSSRGGEDSVALNLCWEAPW